VDFLLIFKFGEYCSSHYFFFLVKIVKLKNGHLDHFD
jgi:hypothetical protein